MCFWFDRYLYCKVARDGTHFTINNRYPIVTIQTITIRTARPLFRREAAKNTLQLIAAEYPHKIVAARVFTVGIGPVACEFPAVDGIVF